MGLFGTPSPYPPKPPADPPIHRPPEILDAAFYVLRSGCSWHLLLYDFPPCKTGLHYFREWRIDRTWGRVNRAIRERLRESQVQSRTLALE